MCPLARVLPWTLGGIHGSVEILVGRVSKFGQRQRRARTVLARSKEVTILRGLVEQRPCFETRSVSTLLLQT